MRYTVKAEPKDVKKIRLTFKDLTPGDVFCLKDRELYVKVTKDDLVTYNAVSLSNGHRFTLANCAPVKRLVTHLDFYDEDFEEFLVTEGMDE